MLGMPALIPHVSRLVSAHQQVLAEQCDPKPDGHSVQSSRRLALDTRTCMMASHCSILMLAYVSAWRKTAGSSHSHTDHQMEQEEAALSLPKVKWISVPQAWREHNSPSALTVNC